VFYFRDTRILFGVSAGTRGKHLAHRAWWARRGFVGGVAAAVVIIAGAGVALAVESGPTKAQQRAHLMAVQQAKAEAAAQAAAAAKAHLLAGLTIAPASGTTGVPLDAPVSVTSTSGTLASVKVVSASGAALTGAIQPGTDKWVSSGALTASTTYSVTADITGGGYTAEQTSTFTTLTPKYQVEASLFPSSGMTVGVGQPIVVNLDHYVTSDAGRRALEARFTVTESQPVPGGWYWFSPEELHFRPQSYWPAHEQISISANLNGLDLGNGRWGVGTVTDSFTIGDARISYVNLDTERMVVTLNGKTLYTFPISGGSPQYPTMDGDHIVLDRQSVVHMVSSTVGIPVHSPNGYDEYVYEDVHISDSGEYVHAAPWSVGSQGYTNVSHGCVNLSPANATTFFGFSRVGDVVEVTGSPRPPATGDHGVMDWSTPWSDWTPGNVVPLNPPAPTTTAPATTTSTTAGTTTTTG
jgi:lipoprotein-anchoring transpeptidase ErfK/SrfK